MAEGSERELEKHLVKLGRRLAKPPSDAEDLVALLDEAETFLSRVSQSPSQSMSAALLPVMKAVVAAELLRHTDIGVKVAVASCICEITRISAPEPPYNDDLMKEIFQIIVDSFKDLDDTSNRLYGKKVSILETVAKIRLCVMMLDLECDSLILEMFNHFLNIKRSDHSQKVSSSMENIMTCVIEESDDISSKLLCCLLASVKEVSKDLFPTAHMLGEKVIGNCSEKLKPYFVKRIQSMDVSFSDYSKIIVSMCQENSDSLEKNGFNVPDEETEDGRLSERTISDKLPQEYEKLESEMSSAEELSTAADMTQKPAVDSGIVSIGNSVSVAVKSDCIPDHGMKKLRGRRRKSSVQLRLTGSPNGAVVGSEMVQRGRNRKVCKSADFSCFDSPPREAHSVMSLGSDENMELPQLAGSDQDNLLNTVRRKRGRPARSKRARRRGSVGTATDTSPPGGKGYVMYNHNEEEGQASKGSVLTKEHGSINNLERKPTRRSRNKFSAQLNAEIELDETLVGSKIKVWWPHDKKFYEGVVYSFNPVTKKHKIVYDDGDVETLLLRNERYKLIKAQEKDSSHTDAVSQVLPKRNAKVTSDSVSKRAKTERPLERGDASAGESTADETVSASKRQRGASTNGRQYGGHCTPRSSNKSRQKSARRHKTIIPVSSSESEEHPEKSEDGCLGPGSKCKEDTSVRENPAVHPKDIFLKISNSLKDGNT